MEMQQIRYFLAVSEANNFTKAAAACGVSPPSLLRAITLLEQEFGGRLFTRDRGNIRLTELGRIAQPHLLQIMHESSEAKRRAKSLVQGDRSTLKLGIMCTIAPVHFVKLIGAFRRRHPRILLQILDRNAEQLETALLAGELEIAIYGVPGQPNAEKFHALPLFEERMVIALAERHPLCRETSVEIAHLDGEPYLERANCEFAKRGEEIFFERGVTGPTVYISERDDWVLAMVAAGMGYSFLPESTAQFSGVTSRSLTEPDISRQINLVTVRGRPHSATVGAFVREVMRAKWMGTQAIAKRDLPQVT